jgi:ABC-type uncharacterized transport system auxiliary subunit
MIRWIALCLLVPLAGCLGGSYQPDVFYAIEPATAVTPVETPTGHTLAVRPIEAPIMLRRPMVYRDGAYKLKAYDAALWADEPSRVLSHELVDALRRSNRFADVASATVMRMPDYLLTGTIQQFEEVREGGAVSAVCAVRIDVRARDNGALLYSATLEASVPFDGTGLEAYAAAMSQAVGQVVSQAVEGIAAAR